MKTKVEVELYSCDNCEGDICYSVTEKKDHSRQSMVGDAESDFHFCCSSCMDDYIISLRKPKIYLKDVKCHQCNGPITTDEGYFMHTNQRYSCEKCVFEK